MCYDDMLDLLLSPDRDEMREQENGASSWR
jgi:hypothetical protein